MNVYDFDKTIYYGDSTIDFYLFSLKRNWSLIRFLPKQIISGIKYKLGLCTKEVFKENFFVFLNAINDIDIEIAVFWEHNLKYIKKWYINQKERDDIIISASPEFLLKPLVEILEIRDVIGSNVDKSTGRFLGKNCYGEEKVIRLELLYADSLVDTFYSDSLSDLPMARKAQNAYLVKNNKVFLWHRRLL